MKKQSPRKPYTYDPSQNKWDLEDKITEDNRPDKPVEPPAKKLPAKTPGVLKLEQQMREWDEAKKRAEEE